MDKNGFRDYLKNSSTINSKSLSVSSRLSKAKKVEKLLDVDLDNYSHNLNSACELLFKLEQKCDKEHISKAMFYAMSNAVRQYYTFMTSDILPKHIRLISLHK